MSVLRSLPRLLAGLCFPASLAALWAGAIAAGSSSAGWSSAGEAMAAARTGAFSMTVGAAGDIAMAILLSFAVLGLVAVVRGRGRHAVVAAGAVMVAGLPAHVIGAVFALMAVQLTSSGLTPADQVRALTPIFDNVGPVYFISLAPYLLGLFAVPAAMWRARIVSWAPLALLVAEMAYQTVAGGLIRDHSVMWWVEPLGCIAAYGWLGIGLVRYGGAAGTTAKPALPIAA